MWHVIKNGECIATFKTYSESQDFTAKHGGKAIYFN